MSLQVRIDRYQHFAKFNGRYLDWQVEQFAPFLGSRILEIGCGVGGILERLGSRELIYGVDVEPDILEFTASHYRDRPEYEFDCLDFMACSEPQFELMKAKRIDSIVCINVLEHIRDDIGALQRMEQLLVPGGYLALLIPAHLGLYGAYDKLDGHYRRYSKPYLRTILGWTGFRITRLYYFNSIGAIGWWAQYRLLGRKTHGEGQFALMDALIPGLRVIEGLIAPPFGLSLVAILQRK